MKRVQNPQFNKIVASLESSLQEEKERISALKKSTLSSERLAQMTDAQLHGHSVDWGEQYATQSELSAYDNKVIGMITALSTIAEEFGYAFNKKEFEGNYIN
jgi:hypothetical protein